MSTTEHIGKERLGLVLGRGKGLRTREFLPAPLVHILLGCARLLKTPCFETLDECAAAELTLRQAPDLGAVAVAHMQLRSQGSIVAHPPRSRKHLGCGLDASRPSGQQCCDPKQDVIACPDRKRRSLKCY